MEHACHVVHTQAVCRGGLRQVGCSRILLNTMLKIAQHQGINIELPLHIGAHHLFHLLDLPECEHAWPRLVGISIIADDLGREHESRNK